MRPGAEAAGDAGNAAERRATIDIGTNSVLLLVAERRDGEWRAILDRATITRLGEGVDRNRELAPVARTRTLACLAEYASLLREHGVSTPTVVGTSAMRDARGGPEFANDVAGVLGVAPRILSGDEEARVTFVGSVSGLHLQGPVTVFDVGGGSTEVITGNAGSTPLLSQAVSLDIGSVRLFERWVHTDPPSAGELEAARRDIEAALEAAPLHSDGATLVGVAGTVTTLAAIALELDAYDGERVHGFRLSRGDVSRVARRLESLTHRERCELKGLEPRRADVIVTGASIVESVLAWSGASELVVSDRGVRWGLLESPGVGGRTT